MRVQKHLSFLYSQSPRRMRNLAYGGGDTRPRQRLPEAGVAVGTGAASARFSPTASPGRLPRVRRASGRRDFRLRCTTIDRMRRVLPIQQSKSFLASLLSRLDTGASARTSIETDDGIRAAWSKSSSIIRMH